MKIEIVTPAPARGVWGADPPTDRGAWGADPPTSNHVWKGNRVTAERWQRLLADLGHDVVVTGSWSGAPADVLVALHARKSAESVRRFAGERPDAGIVVALTGTDVYRDLAHSDEAQESIDRADALVVLQELAVDQVPEPLRDRVRVIRQSATPPTHRPPPREDVFEVAVLANLRGVKDPFLAAEAARRLPAASQIEVVHAGGPLDDGTAEQADAETAANPRYRWLGAVPRDEALGLLARARLLALTSRLEGGANVVSEAIAVGTPVLATRIDGSVGLLGADYPGYVPVGDADALANMLHRAETDGAFLDDLRRRVEALRPSVEPARERAAWADLLADLAGA